MPSQQVRVFVSEKIIEYAQNILILIHRGILTKEEVREMMGLEPKTSNEMEVDGVMYEKKKS